MQASRQPHPVILGGLCYRRIDNDHSRHYRALVEEEKILNMKIKEKYD